jgi:hypothetical protein
MKIHPWQTVPHAAGRVQRMKRYYIPKEDIQKSAVNI